MLPRLRSVLSGSLPAAHHRIADYNTLRARTHSANVSYALGQRLLITRCLEPCRELITNTHRPAPSAICAARHHEYDEQRVTAV